jgi:hypothetical protein
MQRVSIHGENFQFKQAEYCIDGIIPAVAHIKVMPGREIRRTHHVYHQYSGAVSFARNKSMLYDDGLFMLISKQPILSTTQ